MNADTLNQFLDESLGRIRSCPDTGTLEAAEVAVFGKKGQMRSFYDRMKEVSGAEKPEMGKILNRVKTALEQAFSERKSALAEEETRKLEASQSVDISLPGRSFRLGHLHPITQTVREISRIFNSLGFSVAQGPDIELESINFDALNIPDYHPARDMHDTFYIEKGVLLRTHTSNVQIRTMRDRKPPVRIIAPGRCFRNDTIDATHSPIFHQIEGLYVDENVSFADMKYTLGAFAKSLLGEHMKVRFRPSYFPFTEPSAEYDLSCMFCGQKGCRVCKGSGWIEISGAGMVSPAVFRNVGYDNETVTGFAFGMGVERIAMLLFGIDDIRLLYENELEFLEQF